MTSLLLMLRLLSFFRVGLTNRSPTSLLLIFSLLFLFSILLISFLTFSISFLPLALGFVFSSSFSGREVKLLL